MATRDFTASADGDVYEEALHEPCDDIAAVRFEVSRAKANSRQDLHICQKSIFYYLWIDNPS